jgi:ferredoxin
MAIVHSLYREAGTVRIDETTCTRCGQCAAICPADVLSMADGRVRIRTDTPFGCIACGHCMMVCPAGSVTVTGRGISPEDLVPLPPPKQRAGADALTALMLARRSVRRFQDREVDAGLLERIVAAATSAPMGIPPWDVGCTIVRGREQVQELAGEIVKGYAGFLNMFRPWLLALMRPVMKRTVHEQLRSFILPLARTYVTEARQGRDALFYNAPALLIFHNAPYADSADATIACTYAMLTAESLGLGSTMIGGAAPVLRRNPRACRRLGVPAGHTPALVLIVGHPAATFRRAIRRRFTRVDTLG